VPFILCAAVMPRLIGLISMHSIKEKIKLVLKATRQHARNLARFAAIYKTSMLALRIINPTGPGKEGPYDTFFSGLLGGYIVFGSGRQGSVNQQVLSPCAPWCSPD
jgi:peroxisomal membrane protein 4